MPGLTTNGLSKTSVGPGPEDDEHLKRVQAVNRENARLANEIPWRMSRPKRSASGRREGAAESQGCAGREFGGRRSLLDEPTDRQAAAPSHIGDLWRRRNDWFALEIHPIGKYACAHFRLQHHFEMKSFLAAEDCAWVCESHMLGHGKASMLLHLEHVDRETIGANLAIPVGPKAIHLIVLDTSNGH
jgi:hypothetical protein